MKNLGRIIRVQITQTPYRQWWYYDSVGLVVDVHPIKGVYVLADTDYNRIALQTPNKKNDDVLPADDLIKEECWIELSDAEPVMVTNKDAKMLLKRR